ncbi:hypothetical protein V2I21_06165 [Campylobacter sp. CLAX-22107-21]|uniref:hypothetical protein n=1 Tax=Campylobacter devanensis TaxID=3161138 RepID=UPI002ECD4F95|nr:hypothetical protein [Campylobacter sp. CLAX-22107-21]
MNEQIKNISEITLHKGERLFKRIAQLESYDSETNSVDRNELIDLLLEVDNIAANLDKYDRGVCEDINLGHWDIYRACEANSNTVTIKFNDTLVARSPILDIRENDVVAIDFGTKSTVAGFIDSKTNRKQLIRIGGGSYKKDHNKNDYENPTIIEFTDIGTFMEDYFSVKSRPLTSWDDICVSHTAVNHLEEADNENFYRFFTKLKQWARVKNSKIRIKDKLETYTLKDFLKCDPTDINPIEIYAYYIGRYINNMTKGIYINYVLSYPVKYEKAVRDKIKESFERGIKKSIPYAVLTSPKHSINVDIMTSEPAAYAVSALKEYGFRPPYLKPDEVVCYGIFDFGGGTTDFDFGMWRTVDSRKFDYKIEHFGDGGDPTLGGENLLELLAFEIFKDNKAVMKECNCSFSKSELGEDFGGSESIVKDSRESRKNTTILVEYIRPFWENIGKIDEIAKDNKNISNILSGKINLQLMDNDSGLKPVDLEVDREKMEKILKYQISKGVKNFINSFKNVASKMDLKASNDKLCIFLGGNASRSALVMQCFEEEIGKLPEEYKNNFEIFPALGTPEADEKKRQRGLEVTHSDDFSKEITCKTGVVFGLLDNRKGGKIQVFSEISAEDEAKFEFYIGCEKFEKFKLLVDRSDAEFNKGEWKEISDYADEKTITIYYTAEARATSEEGISIEGVKSQNLILDQEYGPDDLVKIKKLSVNSFIYEVFDKNGKKLSNINKEIKLD